MRKNSMLLTVVVMCFLVVIPSSTAKVTFIRPFEYSGGLLFVYGEDSGSLFIPATNNQFPFATLDNITLLIIPDQKGMVQFNVTYGRLNQSTADFLPDITQTKEAEVKDRSLVYNIALSVTESKSYVVIDFPGLKISFSYQSTDDAILLQNSKSTITQIISQNIIIAGLIALLSALAGGTIAKRAGKIIIPQSIYYFVSGVFIALIFFAAATGQNIAIVILYVVIGIVSFFISVKKFELETESIFIDLFEFADDKLMISPNEITVDPQNYVIFETFTDMVLRIIGIKSKLEISPYTKAWGKDEKLYFAEELEIRPPKFVLNTTTLSISGILISSVILWQISMLYGVVSSVVALGLLAVYSHFFEFKIINRGSVSIEFVAAMTCEDIANTMKTLAHVKSVSDRHLQLMRDYHALSIQIEEKSFTNAKELNTKLLDAFKTIVGMKEDGDGKIQNRTSDQRRSSAKAIIGQQKSGKGARNIQHPRNKPIIGSSNGSVDN